MGCHSDELKEKEVICAKDGKRLGSITSFEIDVSCGTILAVFVSSSSGGCFSAAKNEYRIPWDKIECIGEDAILVCSGEWCSPCDSCRMSHRKKRVGWFF